MGCFLQIMPEIVKLDASLIRDIDRDPIKQKLVRSLHQLFDEMDVAVITEGVETNDECKTLVTLGAELLQGYIFARPGDSFPTVSEAAFLD